MASPSLNPKPTPGPIPLDVAAATVDPTDCPETSLIGFLVTDQVTGLGIAVGNGRQIHVVWPPGYSAAPSIAGGILVGPDGNAIAHTGEQLRIEGVVAGQNGLMRACGEITQFGLP